MKRTMASFVALTILLMSGLVVWNTARLMAQDSDPVQVVQAFYQAIQASQFKKAAGWVAGTRDTARAAELADRVVSSKDLFGPPGLGVHTGPLTGCKSNLKNIGTALEMYSTDFAGRFPKTLAPVCPNYLRTIPTCPSAGTDTYSQSYQRGVNPDAYTFFCSGHHHAAAGQAPNFPQYNSREGLIAKAFQEPPKPAWTLVSARVLSSRPTGDRCVVLVDEVYAVHGFATHVEAAIPLRRQGQGWRIDMSAEKLPVLTSEQGPTVWWLKVHGLGYSLAALMSQADVAPPSVAPPVKNETKP